MSIWYISTTGSDVTGDGTLGNPYATVSKCITVGSNNDTIKALTGTYTITSTTNVNKQVTITSNSGVNTDVIFDANCTIFNIQESNISITYVTLQTSSVSELVSIDRMSTGNTIPTFWTGNSIHHCIIKYVTNALTLNGTYSIDNNTFNRNTGSNMCQIIKIYSTRSTCSISSNTFTDSGPVQYILYFTSTGSGAYLDRCNSKGGTLTIASNVVTYTHESQPTTFIYYKYFNQYSFGIVGANSQYNLNTKLSLNIHDNNLSFIERGMISYFDTTSNSDYSTFDVSNIYNNTTDNTVYGVVHLGKNMESNSIVTIDNSDLNRPIFKIYSNTLNTSSVYYDDPRLLRIKDPVTYMSAGTGKPFHSARTLMYTPQEPAPPLGFVATGVTGSVRIYTMLPNVVKFRMVRFTNYFAGGGYTIAPTDTNAGVQQANLYVTDVDPTTVYGSNVSSSNLLWSGSVPQNTGIFIFGRYYPHGDVHYYPTNPLFGKYIILDIVNNWGNATKVGIEKIEFVVEHINTNPVMKLPITGRYLRLRRTDDQLIAFFMGKIYIYDGTDTKHTVTNGVIYPASGYGTWQQLSDMSFVTNVATQGLSTNEYMQLDLGSMKDIYRIELLRGQTSYSQFENIWQLCGVACQILSDTYDILGEYDIYNSIKMGNNGNCLNIIDTSIWNTTISDPASIFLKWDAQQPNTVINTNNLSVSKSNQVIVRWNETKTGDSNWSFFNNDLDGCTVKFVVDTDNYPSILLPGWGSLRTLGNKTVYYDKTIFLVISSSQIQSRSIPFYMGSTWIYPFDRPDRRTVLNSTYSAITYGTMTPPNIHPRIINSDVTTYTNVGDTTTTITKNKKIVIGYKMEFIDSTTMRAVIICSLNPTTIKYTPTVTIGSTLFKTNYTSADCIYNLGDHPKTYQRFYYTGTTIDSYVNWSQSPGFYYELNMHNQLSESDMVTECQRLMTKWKVTP